MLVRKTIRGDQTGAEIRRINPANLESKLYIIKKLLDNNKVKEALCYLTSETEESVAKLFYEKATILFYTKDIEQAENIYTRLLNLEKKEHYILLNKCYFDLAIILINKNEYKKAFDIIAKMEIFKNNIQSSIFALLGLFLRIKFIEAKLETIKNIADPLIVRSAISDYVKNIIKNNQDSLYTFEEKQFKNLSKILFDKGLSEKNIENLPRNILDSIVFNMEELQLGLKTFFYENGEIEEKTLTGLPLNLLSDNNKNLETAYLKYMKSYFIKKLPAIRHSSKIQSIEHNDPAANNDISGFSSNEIVISPTNISDDEILYSIFKLNIQYPDALQASAVFQLIKNKAILKKNSLKAALKRLHLNHTIKNEIYNLLLKYDPQDFSILTQIGIYKFLNNNYDQDPFCSESAAIFKNIINNKNSVSPLDLTLTILGLQHITYLINYKNVKKISDSHKLNIELAVKLIFKEYKQTYNENKKLKENLSVLQKKLNIFYENDIQLIFIDMIARITHP